MAAIGKAKLKRINFITVLIKVNTSLKPQGFVILLSLSRSVPHFTKPPPPASEPEFVLVPAPALGVGLLEAGVEVDGVLKYIIGALELVRKPVEGSYSDIDAV